MNTTSAKERCIDIINLFPEPDIPRIESYLEKAYVKAKTSAEKKREARNAAYVKKINKAFRELEEGNGISFSMEELEAFENMTPDKASDFADKRRAGMV